MCLYLSGRVNYYYCLLNMIPSFILKDESLYSVLFDKDPKYHMLRVMVAWLLQQLYNLRVTNSLLELLHISLWDIHNVRLKIIHSRNKIVLLFLWCDFSWISIPSLDLTQWSVNIKFVKQFNYFFVHSWSDF